MSQPSWQIHTHTHTHTNTHTPTDKIHKAIHHHRSWTVMEKMLFSDEASHYPGWRWARDSLRYWLGRCLVTQLPVEDIIRGHKVTIIVPRQGEAVSLVNRLCQLIGRQSQCSDCTDCIDCKGRTGCNYNIEWRTVFSIMTVFGITTVGTTVHIPVLVEITVMTAVVVIIVMNTSFNY